MSNTVSNNSKNERRSLLASFARPIPYYPALRKLGISTEATILITQLEYWFDKELIRKNKYYFYKFLEPPKGKNTYGYKKGDSWCERLGWTSREFNKAFDEIGVRFNTKGDFDEVLKTDPKKVFEKKVTTKKRKIGGWDVSHEVKTFGYASYYDRMRRKVYYFRNDNFLDAIFEILIENDPNIAKTQPVEETVKTIEDEEELYSTRNAHSEFLGNADSAFPLSVDYKQENTYIYRDTSFASQTNKIDLVDEVGQTFQPVGQEELAYADASQLSPVQVQSSDDNAARKSHNNYESFMEENESSYVRQESGAKNKLVKCNYDDIWEIANEMQVSIGDVKAVHQEVLAQINSGEIKKYKRKDTFSTVKKWIQNKLASGFILPANEMELMDIKDSTPQKVWARKKLDEQYQAIYQESEEE